MIRKASPCNCFSLNASGSEGSLGMVKQSGGSRMLAQ